MDFCFRFMAHFEWSMFCFFGWKPTHVVVRKSYGHGGYFYVGFLIYLNDVASLRNPKKQKHISNQKLGLRHHQCSNKILILEKPSEVLSETFKPTPGLKIPFMTCASVRRSIQTSLGHLPRSLWLWVPRSFVSFQGRGTAKTPKNRPKHPKGMVDGLLLPRAFAVRF